VQVLKILTLLAFCLLLTACWDLQEPGDIGIVIGLGIDAGSKPNAIKVSILLSPPIGGGVGTQGQNTLRVLTAEAVSLFEAITILHSHARNEVFFQHTPFIIFGETLARAGIGDVLGDVLGMQQLRGSTPLLVASGSAQEVLQARSGVGQAPSFDISNILQGVYNAPIALVTQLNTAINTLTSLGSELVLPIVELVPLRLEPADFENLQQQDEKEVIIARVALFDRDRWVSELDPYQTQMLVLLTNNSRQGSLTFANPADPQGLMAVHMDSFRTNYEVSVQGEEVKLTIKPDAGTRLLEIRKNYNIRERGIEPIEQAIRDEITTLTQRLISKLQTLQVDSLGLGLTIARRNPKAWSHLEPIWRQKYPEIQIDVMTRASVKQTGFVAKFFNVVRQGDK